MAGLTRVLAFSGGGLACAGGAVGRGAEAAEGPEGAEGLEGGGPEAAETEVT